MIRYNVHHQCHFFLILLRKPIGIKRIKIIILIQFTISSEVSTIQNRGIEKHRDKIKYTRHICMVFMLTCARLIRMIFVI